METRLTLAPGQHGTKKLVIQQGDRLVRVRYRYDSQGGLRRMVWETDWQTVRAPGLQKKVLIETGD